MPFFPPSLYCTLVLILIWDNVTRFKLTTRAPYFFRSRARDFYQVGWKKYCENLASRFLLLDKDFHGEGKEEKKRDNTFTKSQKIATKYLANQTVAEGWRGCLCAALKRIGPGRCSRRAVVKIY